MPEGELFGNIEEKKGEDSQMRLLPHDFMFVVYQALPLWRLRYPVGKVFGEGVRVFSVQEMQDGGVDERVV